MFDFTKTPRTFPSITTLLQSRLAHQQDGKPAFTNITTFDSVDALVKLVEWERITMTSQEVTHYSKRLYLFNKRQQAYNEAASAQKTMYEAGFEKEQVYPAFVPAPVYNVHLHGEDQDVSPLSAQEQVEQAQLTEALARCMLPVGVMYLLSREEFGVPANGMTDIWQELKLAVGNYAPPMPELKHNPNARGFTLTAFVEDRLSKKIGNLIDDHEGNRKQLETAALMLKYLSTLGLNEYAEHDAQEVLEGIANLHGGTHIWKPQTELNDDGTVKIATEDYLLLNKDGQPVFDVRNRPILIKRGDECKEAVLVENPAFVGQRFNSIQAVRGGLNAVLHTKPLRFDGATNNPETGVLGDTVATSEDYEEDALQADFMAVMENLESKGFSLDDLLEISELVAEIADTASKVPAADLKKWIPMIQASHPEVDPETITVLATELGGLKRRHVDAA